MTRLTKLLAPVVFTGLMSIIGCVGTQQNLKSDAQIETEMRFCSQFYDSHITKIQTNEEAKSLYTAFIQCLDSVNCPELSIHYPTIQSARKKAIETKEELADNPYNPQ